MSDVGALSLYDASLDDLVRRALAEDLSGGDLTSDAVVDEESRAIARAVARRRLVVAGEAIFARAFYLVDPGLRVESLVADGSAVEPGETLWIVEGATRSILAAERTALNFVQRLSGIATLARRYVEALPAGSRTRITDTRKTTPGLRALERYAVRCGGAHNHRDSLGAAVLIKDNHIAALGSLSTAVARAKARAPHTTRIEVEVESLEALEEALSAGADIVMLDNFAVSDVAAAVAQVRGLALVEVSGGVNLESVRKLAEAGVDVISVGALTHSAPAADIALELEALRPSA